jgi:hypothetical protein
MAGQRVKHGLVPKVNSALLLRLTKQSLELQCPTQALRFATGHSNDNADRHPNRLLFGA